MDAGETRKSAFPRETEIRDGLFEDEAPVVRLSRFEGPLDLLLFLTGTYDERICDNWHDAQFSAVPSYSTNEVAQVVSSEIPVPAYRTNHPSARLPKGEMEARYRVIVDDFANKKQ